MNGKLKQIPGVAMAVVGLGVAGSAWAQDDLPTTYTALYNRYAYLDRGPTPPIVPDASRPVPAAFASDRGDLVGGYDGPTWFGRAEEWTTTPPAPTFPTYQIAPRGAIGPSTLPGASGGLRPGGPTGQFPAPGPGMPGPEGSTGQYPPPGPGMPGGPTMPGAATAPPGTAATPRGDTAPPAATTSPATPPAASPAAAAPTGGFTGAAGTPAATFSPGLGGTPSVGGGVLNMIGDQSPNFAIRQVTVPGIPDPSTRSLLAPSVRGFKIAENQSPIPQDRVFYSFNYFEDVNKELNQFFEAPIDNVKIYRHVFGLEKTFNEGKGSLGARLPLNTIHADPRERQLNQGGTSTALGNLSLFGKYVVESNPRTGSLFSVGLSITPRTGPGRFANAPFLARSNTTTIQPFLAYYLNFGKLYLHGFTALDVPTNFRDATLLYNDVGLGYYLMRSPDPDRFLTAIAPTIEAHVNTPLNHRGGRVLFDRFGSPDILNLTSGVNFEFYRRSVLTLGLVTPLTGPRPFDFEAVLLFNVRFGGSRTRSIFPQVAG
jgi:hypothetical protein